MPRRRGALVEVRAVLQFAIEPAQVKKMAKATRREAFDVEVFLSTVDGGRSVSNYRKNQRFSPRATRRTLVFYIQEGQVKLSVISELGKEAVVALHVKGRFLRRGLLERTALAPGDRDRDDGLRHHETRQDRDHPRAPRGTEVLGDVSVLILARNARVEADLVDQLFNSSEKRLARLLLLMASFGKEGPPEPVIAKVSQETLAEMVGTTRSRVSFFMNKFRKLGFIDYNGHLKIHNSLLNVVLHDDPSLKRSDRAARPRTSSKAPRRSPEGRTRFRKDRQRLDDPSGRPLCGLLRMRSSGQADRPSSRRHATPPFRRRLSP